MIDLHSHILPGVDDGVATLEEARKLARTEAAEGVTAIAATPHVRDDYPTSVARMERGVAALRADFAEHRVDVEVLHGGEIALTSLWDVPLDELRRFTIAQTGRYLLLETPYRRWPRSLPHALAHVRAAGIVPILAHPERNPDVQDRPSLLAEPVAAGALVQVTAASVDGRLGNASRAAAFRLLELGLVHLLASDAHGATVRQAGLAAAVAALADGRLARLLTHDVPAAIVAGEPIPRP